MDFLSCIVMLDPLWRLEYGRISSCGMSERVLGHI